MSRKSTVKEDSSESAWLTPRDRPFEFVQLPEIPNFHVRQQPVKDV